MDALCDEEDEDRADGGGSDDLGRSGRGPGRPGQRRAPLGALALPARAESVPRARHWFLRFLAPYPLDRPLDDCVLMLSELVTNAVLHAQPVEAHWLVRVEWWRAGSALHVAVHSPGPPAAVRMRARDDDSPHGRGLRLVNALADDWRVSESPHGGTAVTFTVRRAWRC